jgi:hypothetical protein
LVYSLIFQASRESDMNSVTLRLVAVTGVLVLEVSLIVLNIPALSLVTGIILLGAILFVLGRMVSFRDGIAGKKPEKKITSAIKTEKNPQEKVPGTSAGRDAVPKGGQKSSIPAESTVSPPSTSWLRVFTTVGNRRKKKSLSSRSPSDTPRVPIQGQTTAGDAVHNSTETSSPASLHPPPPKSRFETFRAMGKGMKLLFSTRSRSSKKSGHEAEAPATVKKADRNDKNSQISLTSIRAEAVSPVGQKLEPSPFSPLAKDMVLDADLVLSRQERGKDTASDILNSVGDSDSIEIFAHDSDIAHMDLSLDDETSITIDEEEDDEVAKILEAHHDEFVTPAPDMEEFSIDKQLDELEHFDLDLDEVDPEGGSGPAGATRDTVPPKGSSLQPDTSRQDGALTKSVPDRRRADETMVAFSSGSAGDDDLLSSLRSDLTGKKHQIDQSLVRDLKDVRVHIGEIEKDITELLALYKKFD